MNPAVVNKIISAGLMGLGPGGVLGGLNSAAPVGAVETSGLTGMGVRGVPASVVTAINSAFGSSPATGAPQSGGISTAPTLGGQAPTAATTMGFPAAGLANTPGGGVAPSNAAPVGSTIGQATISSPSGGPNAPSAMATNAGEGGGGGVSGLASAAHAAAQQGTPAAPSTVAQVQQSTPDVGSIFDLIMSLVSGGAGGPQLSNLARNATQGG